MLTQHYKEWDLESEHRGQKGERWSFSQVTGLKLEHSFLSEDPTVGNLVSPRLWGDEGYRMLPLHPRI